MTHDDRTPDLTAMQGDDEQRAYFQRQREGRDVLTGRPPMETEERRDALELPETIKPAWAVVEEAAMHSALYNKTVWSALAELHAALSRSTEEREPEVPQEHMLDAIAEYTVHAPNCPFYEDGNCECAVEAFRETLRRVLVPSRLTAPSQEGEVVAWGWLVEVRQHGKWTVYPADMHNRAPLWRNEGLARCAAKDCADAGFEARVTPARLTPTQEPTEP